MEELRNDGGMEKTRRSIERKRHRRQRKRRPSIPASRLYIYLGEELPIAEPSHLLQEYLQRETAVHQRLVEEVNAVVDGRALGAQRQHLCRSGVGRYRDEVRPRRRRRHQRDAAGLVPTLDAALALLVVVAVVGPRGTSPSPLLVADRREPEFQLAHRPIERLVLGDEPGYALFPPPAKSSRCAPSRPPVASDPAARPVAPLSRVRTALRSPPSPSPSPGTPPPPSPSAPSPPLPPSSPPPPASTPRSPLSSPPRPRVWHRRPPSHA